MEKEALKDAIEKEMKANSGRFETQFPTRELRQIKYYLQDAEKYPLGDSAKKVLDNLKKTYKIDESLKEYKIYFTTPLYPDSEDAEGWTSEGFGPNHAWYNLHEFFKNEGNRGKALMTFYKVEINESKNSVPAFKQIQ